MSNFSLVMTYPRRTFTEEDMQSTLLQLNLAPSAVIIVLPVSTLLSIFSQFCKKYGNFVHEMWLCNVCLDYMLSNIFCRVNLVI